MRSAAIDLADKYSTRPPAKASQEHAWRRGFLAEREGAAQSFCLSVRSSDGRSAQGFPMSMYLRHQWLDRGSRIERLVLVFSNGAVYLEGQYLQRGLDAFEEGKLKRVQAQDANEIAAIRAHNAEVRKPEEKEPIITRVLVSPGFESLLEDEALAPIAQALKEE